MTTIRDLLNRVKWDPAIDPEGYTVEVRVRSDGEERLEPVRFVDISDVLPLGIEVADGTFFPYHRIAAVWRGRRRVWPLTEGDSGHG